MIINIYCIYNNFKKNFYIGSTKDYKQRMRDHKSSCCNPNGRDHNVKVYKYIRENGGWSVWSKMIIATVDVKDKLEQKQYEQFYIDHLEPGLNCCRSYQSHEQLIEYKKEWYNKNKEYLTEKHKEWYNKNKELQNQKINCICGGKYTRANKSHHEKTQKHKNYTKTQTKNLINKYIK